MLFGNVYIIIDIHWREQVDKEYEELLSAKVVIEV